MSVEYELDIRWPIGILFSLLGVLVAFYGLVSPVRTLYRPIDASQVLVFNLNLWWGLVMLAFGLVMVVGALLAGRRGEP